jgi:anti-sigma-K factor RskA
MTAPSTHERYEQLAAGYALSALEPEDENAFLDHLPGCAACRRAVAEHSETLAQLANAVVEGPPPPAVLEGIREQVSQSGAFPAPVSLDAARPRWRDRTMRRTTAVVGAAAAAVLVIALVLVNQGLSSNERQARQVAARLNATVSSLLVDGARKIDLTGPSGGKGAIVVSGQSVSIVTSGVPVNDTSDSVYVLWSKSRLGQVRAVGTFDIRSERLSVVNDLRLSQDPDTVAAFLVTKEPGRTAPAVTHQPVVVLGDV